MKKCITVFFLLLTIQGIGFAQDPWIDSLRTNLENAETDTIRVDYYNSISSHYVFQRLDSALFYANKGLNLARKINYPKGEADALGRMSLSNSAFGNESQALRLCLQTIKITDKNVFTANKGWQLIQLGNIYKKSKNYLEAIDSYQQAISLFNSFSQNPEIGLLRLGETYMLMNELDSALYYCHLVIDDEVKLDRNDYINNVGLYVIGRIQHKLGNMNLALNYFRRSLPIKGGEANNIFNSNFALANLFLELNDMDSCIYYADKSLEIAKQSGFYSNIIDAGVLLSDVFENKNPSKALQYNRLAKAYADSLYTMSKIAAFDNLFDFNEQERQYELTTAKAEYQNRLRLNIFLGSTFTLLVVAFLLYRNSRQKQRSKRKVEIAYERLKNTQAQLIQSEKMASLGELTAGIAHEIRNPLNFVNNFSEVNRELIEELKEAVASNNQEEIQEILKDLAVNEDKVKHHGQRAEGIVKSMLEHSRTSDGKKEPTDINALVDEYLRLAYHGLRAKDNSFNAEFKTEFDESLTKINVIPQDIGRVLLNLINNAFYAVYEKSVRHSDPEHDEGVASQDYNPMVIVSTKKLDNKIEISVKDNGPGIPDEIKDKIFQPFFTTKPTGSGTGLGLSLSYDILKAHGGEIRVKSEEGKGTDFIINLPNV